MTQIGDLLAAAKKGNTLEVERLISALSFEDIEHSGALQEAAKNGQVQCVKILADKCCAENILEVLEDVRYGNPECVMELIDALDCKVQHRNALYYAVNHGNAEMVQFLIPFCDPGAQHSLALRHAAENGHTECLKLLIPVSDPKANKNQALRSALLKQHMDCAKVLYPVSDSQAVLDSLEELVRNPHPNVFHAQLLEARDILETMMQKDQLEQSIGELAPASSPFRKL